MAANTTMLHVRVDQHLKEQATQTLSLMGLSLSDAVRVFLTRVVADRELPFAVQAPNAISRAAMAEAHDIIQGQRARFADADALLKDLDEKTGVQ